MSTPPARNTEDIANRKEDREGGKKMRETAPNESRPSAQRRGAARRSSEVSEGVRSGDGGDGVDGERSRRGGRGGREITRNENSQNKGLPMGAIGLLGTDAGATTRNSGVDGSRGSAVDRAPTPLADSVPNNRGVHVAKRADVMEEGARTSVHSARAPIDADSSAKETDAGSDAIASESPADLASQNPADFTAQRPADLPPQRPAHLVPRGIVSQRLKVAPPPDVVPWPSQPAAADGPSPRSTKKGGEGAESRASCAPSTTQSAPRFIAALAMYSGSDSDDEPLDAPAAPEERVIGPVREPRADANTNADDLFRTQHGLRKPPGTNVADMEPNAAASSQGAVQDPSAAEDNANMNVDTVSDDANHDRLAGGDMNILNMRSHRRDGHLNSRKPRPSGYHTMRSRKPSYPDAVVKAHTHLHRIAAIKDGGVEPPEDLTQRVEKRLAENTEANKVFAATVKLCKTGILVWPRAESHPVVECFNPLNCKVPGRLVKPNDLVAEREWPAVNVADYRDPQTWPKHGKVWHWECSTNGQLWHLRTHPEKIIWSTNVSESARKTCRQNIAAAIDTDSVKGRAKGKKRLTDNIAHGRNRSYARQNIKDQRAHGRLVAVPGTELPPPPERRRTNEYEKDRPEGVSKSAWKRGYPLRVIEAEKKMKEIVDATMDAPESAPLDMLTKESFPMKRKRAEGDSGEAGSSREKAQRKLTALIDNRKRKRVDDDDKTYKPSTSAKANGPKRKSTR